jgi:peptidyl-prolyl cis-trans isomerase C
MAYTKPRFLLVGAVSLMLLAACNSKSGSDPTVATVNGVAIKASRVDQMVKQGAAQGQQDSPEFRKKIIENLALQSVIAAEAVKKGLDKVPETVDQLELIKQSVLANAFVQDYMKTNPVSDDAAKAEYEKIKAQKGGKEYKARHILVAKEADAKDIIAKLKKDPKSFSALAKAKSMDPGSKGNGGDLGWFSPQSMVPEFGTAVGKLEKGKFTEEPVKSQFGYHVIMLDDTRDMPFPAFEQVKEQVKQQTQQQNLQKFIEDTKSKLKIEYVAAAPAPAAAAVSAPAASPAASAPATK